MEANEDTGNVAARVPERAQSRRAGRRAHELTSLNAVAEVLNRTEDLPQALAHTLAIVAGVLGLHSGWVWLLDEAGAYVPAASYNLPPHLQNPANMSGWLCHCLRVFQQGDLRGAANINVLSCSRLDGVVDGTDGLRYHASVPIYLGDRKIGVLNVAMPHWHRLGAEELQFLYTVGYQVGLAVEHRRLLQVKARLAQVEERNRLAREIHDTVAQSLAGLVLQLEGADALWERGSEAGRAALHEAEDVARAALEDVRRSVLDLRAAPLEGQTLSEALRDAFSVVERQNGLRGALTVRGEERTLTSRVEMVVFRVAQAAIANVVSHAAATEVVLTLDVGQARLGWLQLTVADDGRGFEAEPGEGHFGLRGMRERARLVGGTLAVASSRDRGTSVTLEIPLDG